MKRLPLVLLCCLLSGLCLSTREQTAMAQKHKQGKKAWQKRVARWKRLLRLKKLKNQEGSLLDEVARLDRRRLALMARLQKLQTEAKKQEKEVAQATQHAAMQNQIWSAMQKRIRPRLRLFYRLSQIGHARLLISARSVRTLGLRWSALRYLTERDLRMLRQYQELRKLAQQSTQQLQRKQKRLKATMTRLQEQRTIFLQSRKEKKAALHALYKEADLLRKAMGEVRGSQRALRHMLRGWKKSPNEFGLLRWKGRLPWPIRGFSPYCHRYKTKWAGSFAALSCKDWRKARKPLRGPLGRTGATLHVPVGTPVLAVAAGRVAHQGWMRGYGQLMLIEHGFRFYTLYAHLSRFGPRKGEMVKAGQVIGLTGDTGMLGEPGLYFEIRHRALSIRPEAWFKPVRPPF